MVLVFYSNLSHPNSEPLAEIACDFIPAIGQKVLLPQLDSIYVVVDTILKFGKWGNNYPTSVEVTVKVKK